MRGPLAILLSLLVLTQPACRWESRAPTLPDALSDDEFWRLTSSISEPPGAFTHSDNLVSNEIGFVHLLRLLRPSGGVYIGVGPEQNFSYIARLRPAMAFIVDIRRENRSLHFMYKALFELSRDRADFVSRLFSRERPAGIGPQTSVEDLFAAYGNVRPAERLLETNARQIRERLLETHAFPLDGKDFEWIEYALRAFFADGPDIHYARTRPGDVPGPSYATLMTATDARGERHSYLATEEGFAFVKSLQATNRIVPIVGDFAGPHALRRAGSYVRDHGSVVTAFYASNVEVYLNREQMAAYCGNLGELPLDTRPWYIGSKGMQPLASRLKSCRDAAHAGGRAHPHA
jgi:hypothetical protein